MVMTAILAMVGIHSTFTLTSSHFDDDDDEVNTDPHGGFDVVLLVGILNVNRM
jgi:hypothetical protein